MFTFLVKYKNVVTDEEIDIIKQNKAIDYMYVCQEILKAANVKNTGY